MDDRKQRLIVTGDEGDGLAFFGWEVADAAALDRLAARLEAHGIAVQRAARHLADERQVADLIAFGDPAGNRLEAFHGPAIASDPFKPGRPISGFRTGPLGMGHAVINVEDVEPLLPFYRDVLGFHVTDYGLKPYKLYFFHINGRHHSFAMVGSGKAGLHHFMVELYSLDDVGQGYDLANLEENRVAYTLGRHTNDHMTSFYSHTPSGFFVEYGWGGRVIDPATWGPHETHDGPSFWATNASTWNRRDAPACATCACRPRRGASARRCRTAPGWTPSSPTSDGRQCPDEQKIKGGEET